MAGVGETGAINPIRAVRPPSFCCAVAMSGQATAPPAIVTNSRRLIAAPEAKDRRIVSTRGSAPKGVELETS